MYFCQPYETKKLKLYPFSIRLSVVDNFKATPFLVTLRYPRKNFLELLISGTVNLTDENNQTILTSITSFLACIIIDLCDVQMFF